MSLQKFENNLFELEVMTNNGETLFNAELVAKSLGIVQMAKSGNEVVRWERVNRYLKLPSPQVGIESSFKVAKGDFITEPMVYKLAFKANNALAEKFQDWLATEVLPAIRKHGGYLTPDKLQEALMDPDTIIQLAMSLKSERDKNMLLEQQISEYEPKINYLDIILSSKDTVTVTQIAADYGRSAIEFNKLLNELGVQHKVSGQWILYRKHMQQGYVKSQTTNITLANGENKAVMNTKWTQKGRLFLYDLLKANGYFPQLDLELE